MAPSRNMPPRPPSRSRFQEGSMNDRTSAVPPFQFLEPPEPDEAESVVRRAAVGSIRSVPAEYHHQQDEGDVGRPSGSGPAGDKPKVAARGERRVVHKKSSKFLGQVWDGVSRKLGWRKDAPVAASDDPVPQQSRRSTDLPAPSKDARVGPMSKEEILASYHDLVASGFFTSHAIPSARHAPPPPPGHAPSRPGTSASTAAGASWPLPPSNAQPAEEQEQHAATVKVTRRGTKRSAVDEDASTPGDGPRSSTESAKRGLGLPSPKKLRKSPSSLARSSFERSRAQQPQQQQQQQQQQTDLSPRLRTSTSRRNLLGLRSSSSAASAVSGRLTAARSRPPPVSMATRMNAGVVIPERGSSARRTVSFGSSDRVLRSHSHSNNNSMSSSSAAYSSPSMRGNPHSRGNARGATRGIDEVLQVVPDANRGIPDVPRIPEKFTFGEDRENDGPWRGLKVMPARRSQEEQEPVDDESDCEMF